MQIEALKNIDEKTFNYISYSIIVVISIISGFGIFSRFNDWPTTSYLLAEPSEVHRELEVPTQKNTTQIREENYTYEESLEAFEGLRIQIVDCSAQPFSVTYKNNTRILLDGRSPDPQKIIIGGKSVVLDSYSSGYMTLSENNVPTKLSINCQYLGQDYFNIGTITLQP